MQSADLNSVNQCILVVEQDAALRRGIALRLEQDGFTCLQAAEAVAGRWILNSRPVEAVVVNMWLPDLNGLDFLNEIRTTGARIPVFILAAPADTELAVESLQQGATEFVIKPVDFEALATRLSRRITEHGQQIRAEIHETELRSVIREQTKLLHKAHEETVLRLVSASMYRDEETGEHVHRVGRHSAELARLAGWSNDAIDQILLAAPMHDVGKIGIPDAVLRKPGQLTDHEMSIMKTHTLIGANMLKNSSSPMLQMARAIAMCHHERWDGAGYPFQLAGLRIPAAARIVAIVDVFDALTHDRVYRDALSLEKTTQILDEGRCRHFDPLLLDKFLANVDVFLKINEELPDRQMSADEFVQTNLPVAQLANGEDVEKFEL